MLLLEGVSKFYRLKLLFLDRLGNWSEEHLAVGARRQSPIGIDDDNAVSKQLPPLQFHNYDKMFVPIVENTGSTIRITLKIDNEDSENCCEDVPTIGGGPLEYEYLLKEIHFHWESEHTINGKRFPLECHLIHFRKDASSFDEALHCSKGICILSALYEVSKCENTNFNIIAEAAEEVCDEIGTPVISENEISCKSILPKYKSNFYTYEGSFTTPDYKENVIWIVLGEPGRIARNQLKSLTNINNSNDENVQSNRRDLQEINDREIIYTSTLLSRVRKAFRKLSGMFCE